MRIDTPEVIAGFDELRADLEVAIENGVVPDDRRRSSDGGDGRRRLRGRQPHDGARRLSVDDAAKFATALFLGGVHALPRKARGKQG